MKKVTEKKTKVITIQKSSSDGSLQKFVTRIQKDKAANATFIRLSSK